MPVARQPHPWVAPELRRNVSQPPGGQGNRITQMLLSRSALPFHWKLEIKFPNHSDSQGLANMENFRIYQFCMSGINLSRNSSGWDAAYWGI